MRNLGHLVARDEPQTSNQFPAIKKTPLKRRWQNFLWILQGLGVVLWMLIRPWAWKAIADPSWESTAQDT